MILFKPYNVVICMDNSYHATIWNHSVFVTGVEYLTEINAGVIYIKLPLVSIS